MFAELERVMASAIDDGNYLEALKNNVTGKKSSSGVTNTANYLKGLYGFDYGSTYFKAFEHFWKISDANEKPLITFVYAVSQDTLLSESVALVCKVILGDKVSIEMIEHEIEKKHPNQYSPITRIAVAQRIASSWKQAGFIEGKVKNIRTQPDITHKVACFAFLLAYLAGDRGDFIWSSVAVMSLCLPEHKLRELASVGAKIDLIQYQYAGSVTSIGFTNLLNKIGIDANTN
jgi:hypothetical protein